MGKKAKLASIVIRLGVLGVLFGIAPSCALFGPPALGTGSMKHARLWKEKLAACKSLDDVCGKFNCGRYESTRGGSLNYIRDPDTYEEGNAWALLYEFPNGDWLAVAYASSHNTWGGGTVVTRDNKGVIRAFFGHVCGQPFAHGESLEAIYNYFGGRGWKEINLGK